MNRESVESEMLASVGYDAATQTLEAEFKGGDLYQYFDVPQSVHTELMASDSVGGYFSAHIRNSYRYARL